MPHDESTLRQVARLHATCLTDGFLTRLGPRFLIVLYRAIDRCDSSVLIVSGDSSGITGFVAGGVRMRPVCQQMLRDWPALIAALAPAIFRPRQVLGMIEILRRGGDTRGDDLPSHELFSIAVAPAFRGNGTSEGLYQALCTHFRDRGISAFRIVVGGALAPAHRFYTRMGAVPVGEMYLHGDSISTIFVQNIQDE